MKRIVIVVLSLVVVSVAAVANAERTTIPGGPGVNSVVRPMERCTISGGGCWTAQ